MKTMGRPWIRKRDSKREYYSIINDLRLTDIEDLYNQSAYKRSAKNIGNHSSFTFILFK